MTTTTSGWQTLANLSVLALCQLIGGMTYSLLSPFYTKEAADKGISVTQTGLVYSSMFLTSIVFSPLFGKYLSVLGSDHVFVYGTLLAGATNVLFGALQWVDGKTEFLTLSFLIRIVSAIGESAFFAAIYPLAAQAVDESRRTTALSLMETMFGVGLMVGPFVGGVLYELGDFYLPFFICGGALLICSGIACFLLKTAVDEDEDEAGESASFVQLLRQPAILYSCLTMCLSAISVSWYLPSLQPYVEEHFHLGAIGTGALFMMDGMTYALLSPFWGWLLDRGVAPRLALLVGNACIVVGYLMLGPAPFLTFLPHNVYLVGAAMSVHGFGVAANYLTTLSFMLDHAVESGAAPNTEQTRGMITSLWTVNECLGNYLGSTLGGVTFDVMGFENATLIVVGIGAFLLMTLPLFCWLTRRTNPASNADETTRLLMDVEETEDKRGEALA